MTKPLLFSLSILLITLGSGFGQSSAGGDTGKNKMVFPSGAAKPQPTPTVGVNAAPQELISAFFEALKKNQIDAAYDTLVKNTIIAERREDVEGLKKRTMEALDAYGPVLGFETVDEVRVGNSLERRTCISLSSDLPLRWRFYFYKAADVWKLVDLRVDDGLVELFEDQGRVKR